MEDMLETMLVFLYSSLHGTQNQYVVSVVIARQTDRQTDTLDGKEEIKNMPKK